MAKALRSAQVNLIKELSKSHRSNKEIAEQVGCSEWAVRKYQSENFAMHESNKKPTNKLSQDRFYSLCKALERDDREGIVNNLTVGELGKRYTDEMGSLVTGSNVKSACRVVGVEPKVLRQVNTPNNVKRLESVVRRLCEKLGEDYDSLLSEPDEKEQS